MRRRKREEEKEKEEGEQRRRMLAMVGVSAAGVSLGLRNQIFARVKLRLGLHGETCES